MTYLLGIDIGGSGSRAALRRRDGGDRQVLDGDRVGVTAAGASVPAATLAMIRAARRAWPEETDRLAAVAVGATGLGTLVTDPYALVASIDQTIRAASSTPVAIAIDAVTAHLGALAGAAGAVVAVGTGTIAFGTDLEGVWRRVDGWGHLLGDRGAGVWIGLTGLQSAVRALDGVDPSGRALLDAAMAQYGDPTTWPGQLYTREDRAGVLAAFAKTVAGLADRGDAAAIRVMERAGAEAAGSLAAALGSDLPPRAAATGGLFNAGGAFVAAFEQRFRELRPDATLVDRAGDPIDGVLTLAQRSAEGSLATHPPYLWTNTDAVPG